MKPRCPTIYEAGDNPLHEAVRNCLSFNDFIERSKHLSLADKIQYCLTTNDDGHLPLDLWNPVVANDDRIAIFDQMLKWALQENNKDIYEPVSFKEICELYKPDPNSELYINLKNACKIVNKTREYLKSNSKISLTHPHINESAVIERVKFEQKKKAENIREQNDLKKIIVNQASFKFDNPNNHHIVTFSISQEVRTNMHRVEKRYLDNKINNCDEISSLNFHIGRDKKIPVSTYYYDVGKGDHVFNAIIDSKFVGMNDSCHAKFISKNSVIMDGWSGMVCPGSEYQMKLGDFKYYEYNDKNYNLVAKFNPQFNKIIEDNTLKTNWPDKKELLEYPYRIKFDDALFEEIITPYLCMFSAREIYLYFSIIQKNLKTCISRNLISEAEVRSWSDPRAMFEKYFSYDCQYLPLITYLYSANTPIYKEKLKEALAKGADINQADINGKTVLHDAVMKNDMEIFKFLMPYKPDVNKIAFNENGSWETPLTSAIRENNIDIARSLINAGANLYQGTSAVLFLAVIKNSSEMVDLLLNSYDFRLPTTLLERNVLRNIVRENTDSMEVKNRLAYHIYKQMEINPKALKISITPIETAAIFGHTQIEEKLKDYEKIMELKTQNLLKNSFLQTKSTSQSPHQGKQKHHSKCRIF